MQIKRLYDWTAPRNSWSRNDRVRATPLVSPAGEVITDQIMPPVRAVRVLTAPEQQHFSERLIEGAAGEGWLRVDGDRIVITTETGPLVYRVEKMPGRYCCHCGDKLEDDDFFPNGSKNPKPGVLARAHVDVQHGGTASPDPNHPAGYSCGRYFDCVKVAAVAAA